LENDRFVTLVVLVATLAFHALYVLPATRRIASKLMQEDQVVETVTFLALLLASVLGVGLALRCRREGQPRFVWVFFLSFAIGLFFVAMEEVSWGQWIFFFKTPDSLRGLNRQGETNLHNLGGLQGHSEWLRLVFAGGGLIGVLANRRPRLRLVATPGSLTGWYVIMTTYVVFDSVNDFVTRPWILSTFNPMSEWVEMLIGLSAVAYFVLKRDLFTSGAAVEDRRVEAQVAS
jgi:hypothetical protein